MPTAGTINRSCRLSFSASPAIRARLVLDRTGEGETRLLRSLLGLAAHPTGQGHLVATPQLVRLSQARGHLRACEFFMHEIHVVPSISVGLHRWLFLYFLGGD
jgi:hypothetical protein